MIRRPPNSPLFPSTPLSRSPKRSREGDAAVTAGGDRYNTDWFSFVLRQEIIESIFQDTRVTVVIFRGHEDDRISASNVIGEFLHAWRHIIAMMHAFFHDWQIVFEQIDQVSFHDRAE